MISDADIESILRGAPGLEDGGRVPDQGGEPERGQGQHHRRVVPPGRATMAPGAADQDTLAGSETIHQGLTADDVQAAVREQERAAARAPATGAGAPAPRGLPTHARRSRGRRALTVAGRGCWWWGLVVVRRLRGHAPRVLPGHRRRGAGDHLRGVPYGLPLGLDLYSEQYASKARPRGRWGRPGASGCWTTSGAARPMPRIWCASSSGAPSTPAATP